MYATIFSGLALSQAAGVNYLIWVNLAAGEGKPRIHFTRAFLAASGSISIKAHLAM